MSGWTWNDKDGSCFFFFDRSDGDWELTDIFSLGVFVLKVVVSLDKLAEVGIVMELITERRS